MRHLQFTIGLIFLTVSSFAGKIDTVWVYSTSMQKNIPNIIITPDKYKKEAPAQQFPVVYLLHGAGGDHLNWLAISPNLPQLADLYNILIICPDGGVTSWYYDSPVDSTMRYETYVSKELVEYADTHYPTIKSKEARAIAGLSMGGHGALYLATRHPDVFHAAGSMSGGVDIRPFPKNWDIAKRLGPIDTHRDNWEKHTITNMLPQMLAANIGIIIDCGVDDFFYKVTKELHEKMLALKIPHDYIEKPGSHNGAYWKEALPFQLLFFSRSFHRHLNKQ